MTCTRGAASPRTATRYRLFADAAGHCQNPSCLASLFVDLPVSGDVHFGEIAHVIAASADGPRGSDDAEPEELRAWSNLILLCANCHTMVDRGEGDFPPELLIAWKTGHLDKVEAALGLASFASRQEVHNALEPLQLQNRFIHEARGPDNEYRFDPDSEMARMWKRDVVETIIPNHRSILRIIDANRNLLTQSEQATVERYRMHVRDIEGRHVHGEQGLVTERYPREMDSLYADEPH